MDDVLTKAKTDPLVAFEELLVGEMLAVTRTTLKPGGEVPWHRHKVVRDCFTCAEGRIEIQTNTDAPGRVLAPGEQAVVEPGTGHRVLNAGDGDATFVLVQTGGPKDFLAYKPKG